MERTSVGFDRISEGLGPVVQPLSRDPGQLHAFIFIDDGSRVASVDAIGRRVERLVGPWPTVILPGEDLRSLLGRAGA